MRQTHLLGRPSLISASLGGAAGVLLFGAILQVAPATGAGTAGVGALFTFGTTALWPGAILLFVIGWLVLPLLMIAAWKTLPGHSESVGGALLKGTLFGIGLWVVVGLLLPLLGSEAGLFAAADGVGGAVVLLVASLGYGIVAAAIASMTRGIAPLHTLGWEGHGAGRAG